MPTRTTDSVVADLHHSGDGNVLVQPSDYDTFLLSQRECVQALSNHHKMIEAAEQAKEQVSNLFMDIAAWGRQNGVAAIIWSPRSDEGFFAVIASNEDDDSTVQNSLSGLDYDLSKKYNFRLSFLLFRASEAEGLASFIRDKSGKYIYSAVVSRPSGSGKS
jgi:hypothetical protein